MADEYRKVEVPEGSEISTDNMHDALQEHIKNCAQCKEAISQTGRHMSGKLGTRTRMCGEYLKIVQYFATL